MQTSVHCIHLLRVLMIFYGLAFQEDVVWLLGEEMKKFEDVNGFVIDGFPANLTQGRIIHYSIQFLKNFSNTFRYSHQKLFVNFHAKFSFVAAKLFEQTLGSPSHIINIEVGLGTKKTTFEMSLASYLS